MIKTLAIMAVSIVSLSAFAEITVDCNNYEYSYNPIVRSLCNALQQQNTTAKNQFINEFPKNKFDPQSFLDTIGGNMDFGKNKNASSSAKFPSATSKFPFTGPMTGGATAPADNSSSQNQQSNSAPQKEQTSGGVKFY